jgi:hypothetical protein
MGTTNYPLAYQVLNQQSTKQLNVVVQFAGISTLFSMVQVYEKIRYGDPRIHYGDPGIVYGGLIAISDVEPILMVDSGLNISQQIEPEQGRGSVATISLTFVDKDGIMTQLIAENSLVPEPLINILVTVSLGFVNSSFPDDYYKVFRGYITNITSKCGMVTLELSDANVKRRQTIFFGATTALGGAIDPITTIIPVINTSAIIEPILGPNGSYDPSVTTYLLVDSEVMTYSPSTIVAGSPVFIIASWVNTNNYVTVSSALGIVIGDYISAVGLPEASVVTNIIGNNIYLNQTITAGSSGGTQTTFFPPLSVVNAIPVLTTGTWVLNQNYITVTSAVGIVYGMSFFAGVVGWPSNTIVTGISGNNIILSAVATTNQATLTNANFYPSVFVFPRGGNNSRGTTAQGHDQGAAVTNPVQFQGNLIDLALKIMLSGWGGPWISGVAITALGTSLDPSNPQPGGILLPPGVDAVDDYGLTIGDYVYITDSVMGNDGTYVINGIQNDLGDTNRLVTVTPNFPNIENPANTVNVAFRSQYDTFPLTCGVLNTPQDIDITTHQYLRQLLFTSDIYTEQIYISDTQNGQVAKDLIEGTLWLPAGLYTITRYGRVSVAVTLPPIAGQSMIYVDWTTVINPDKIQITRATNKRRFYNVIQYNYDLDDQGNYDSQNIFLDETSANPIDLESILPINADGVKTSLGGNVMIQIRGLAILNRYKKAAFEVTVQVQWSVASMIECGDIIALVDNGQLQISNLETGVRNLGTQLFEVINRSLNIKGGYAELTLLSNTGYQIGQRYGTISPSSIVTTGSTNNSIEIQDSYGPLYPGNEQKKWTQLVGLPIIVHDQLWTMSATAILNGFSPADPYRMMVSPNLPFVPPAGYIVDVVNYGTGMNPETNALYKTLFAHIDPTLTVISGVSQTQFYVSLSDSIVLNIGLPVMIHDQFYNDVSNQVNVTAVNLSTGLVTVKSDLGFIPSAGMLIEYVGFKDYSSTGSQTGGPYLIL